MEVPLPRAASRRLMSFLTFHISIYGRIRTYRQHANITSSATVVFLRARVVGRGMASHSRSSRPRWRWDPSWRFGVVKKRKKKRWTGSSCCGRPGIKLVQRAWFVMSSFGLDLLSTGGEQGRTAKWARQGRLGLFFFFLPTKFNKGHQGTVPHCWMSQNLVGCRDWQSWLCT